MANIKINKDIEEYSEGLFIGLSVRECLGGFLAFGIGAVMIYILQKFMPILAAAYLGLIPSIIVGFFVFYKPNGMSFKDMILCRKKLRTIGKLVSSSTDIPKTLEELTQDSTNAVTVDDFNTTIKKMLIKGGIVIVILIIASVMLKLFLR